MLSSLLDDLKRGSRLLLVDDKDFEYLELLKGDGYRIESWKTIDSIETVIAQDFSVILLDLYGIGKEFSVRDHGLAVLEALKARSSAQLVAVYSASKWDIGQQKRYMALADEVIDKARSDYAEFTGTINRLLYGSVDPKRYVELISGTIGLPLPPPKRALLERILTSSPPGDVAGRLQQVQEVLSGHSRTEGQWVVPVRTVVEVATSRLSPWIIPN